MLPYNTPFSRSNNIINKGIKFHDLEVNINEIDFYINNIEIYEETQYTTFGSPTHTTPRYRIHAWSENENYMKIDNWLSKSFGNTLKRDYVTDIKIHGVNFYNVFLVDYTFEQYNINVEMTFDYIDGDLSLLNKQILRREKLKRINEHGKRNIKK